MDVDEKQVRWEAQKMLIEAAKDARDAKAIALNVGDKIAEHLKDCANNYKRLFWAVIGTLALSALNLFLKGSTTP